MPRLSLLVRVLAAALVAGALLAPATATADPSGGDITAACRANEPDGTVSPRLCRSAQAVEWGAAAACRKPAALAPDPSAPERCAVIDGRPVSPARIDAYRRSWVHRALSLQRRVDASAPLFEEQLVHTHNTFNSSAYVPTLTNQDANQPYSITDQLRMDVRAIELDLHWVPSPFGNPSTGGKWVTLCHGTTEDPTGQTPVHVGCTWDRPFQDGLDEVASWLDANPGEFLVIYLENQLNGDPQAHDIAAQLISTYLDRGRHVVYRPPAGRCDAMPYDTSQAQMMATGARVLLVGNCGPGSWGTWVHERGPKWDESGDPTHYSAADCAKDRAARETHSSFRRWYEDSTWLTAMVSGEQHVSPAGAAAMTACGVNIVGLDQLTPEDGRLAALVWSWAQDEPRAGAGPCAVQGSDGRWRASDCRRRNRVACQDGAGQWHVPATAVAWDRAFTVCSALGYRFAAPVNGYRNQRLVETKAAPSDVWVNVRDGSGGWAANAPRRRRR